MEKNSDFNVRAGTDNDLPDELLVALKEVGREIMATRADTNEDITDRIKRWTRKKALDNGCGLRLVYTKTGGFQWRQVPMSEVEKEQAVQKPTSIRPASETQDETDSTDVLFGHTSEWKMMSDDQIKDLVGNAYDYRPDNLIISEIKWKYLIRSALRGKNILMVGPSGCGKTLAALSVGRVFNDRPFFSFNLGATQDPRGALIGNTHFNRDDGTFVTPALFVRAIQTPGAIILLDELSRAHDDAANILMTVLDQNQRYLRIDEAPDTPTIKVAPGVVFLATANVGNEYTGTRVMDRALLDRFVTVEMDALDLESESNLLKGLYPNVEEKFLEAIAAIADHTRLQVKSEDPKVSTIISTRMSVEMAGLLDDGFTLAEACEICVYPFYPPWGGTDSERTYMQQLVQKYLPTEFDDKERPWDDDKDVENKVPWDN